jgi:hypothetical protein
MFAKLQFIKGHKKAPHSQDGGDAGTEAQRQLTKAKNL